MCIMEETVFMAVFQGSRGEYILVTDLQGNRVRDWGSSTGNGPCSFSGVSSITYVDSNTILVSDAKRVQAFRSDGSCLRIWGSSVCGEQFGVLLFLGCVRVRKLMCVLDHAAARIDVFDMHGPGRFAFPVMNDPFDLTCGPEEVFVLDQTQIVVYSALDGTQLRTLEALSTQGFPTRGYIDYGPRSTLAIVQICSRYFIDGIRILSADDGRLLVRGDHNTDDDEVVAVAWQKNSELWGLRERAIAPFNSNIPFIF